MSDIDSLREQRIAAWRRVKGSHELYCRARKLCEELHKRYDKDEREYEEIDHKLAMLDGRFARLQAAAAAASTEKHKSRRREIEWNDLTLEQKKAVAIKLGISIPELEEIEEAESVEPEED